MLFSFIVPVYNVEKYLGKCLDSLVAQSHKDFEIIVVNDGSPDNSQSIIDAYCEKYPDIIKGYIKENGGLSDARNFGVERAGGDYIAFIDSDDYVAADMLEKLVAIIDEDKPDVLGYNLVAINESGKQIYDIKKPDIRRLSGEEAIIAIVKHKRMFETAPGFVYRREFWNEKGFSFIKGIYHEDFALIPNVILRAGTVSCIDLDAYFYLIREGSITNVSSDERRAKLAKDMLVGYDFLKSELERYPAKIKFAAKSYMAYAADAVIFKLDSLNGETAKWYRKEIIKRKVTKHLMKNTLRNFMRMLYIRTKYRV